MTSWPRSARPTCKVQMDLYHCQIVEGDVAMKIRQYLPTGRVGHFQIAGVPERHEPDLGELNYAYLFDVIDEVAAQCGWQGWVGCEYRPARGAQPGGTSAGPGLVQALARGSCALTLRCRSRTRPSSIATLSSRRAGSSAACSRSRPRRRAGGLAQIAARIPARRTSAGPSGRASRGSTASPAERPPADARALPGPKACWRLVRYFGGEARCRRLVRDTLTRGADAAGTTIRSKARELRTRALLAE